MLLSRIICTQTYLAGGGDLSYNRDDKPDDDLRTVAGEFVLSLVRSLYAEKQCDKLREVLESKE